MRILFLVLGSLEFDVKSPEEIPLGGTESAVCYLARALAKIGHFVTLSNPTIKKLENKCGVIHVPKSEINREHFDVVIVPNAPFAFVKLKTLFPDSKLVLWNHLLPSQPAMKYFKLMRDQIDEVVFVSEKQRKMFNDEHGVVLPNAIAPCFEHMFYNATELMKAKELRGAYTSTPYRGLDKLQKIRELPIDIFSSMQVYQASDHDFIPMYEELSHNGALRMNGSVPQPELAHYLMRCSFLVYPSTFEECHSIAILEAQAAGLKVITTPSAMEPDGYADIVTQEEYIPKLAENISVYKENPLLWAERRLDQVRYINDRFTWKKRAREWESMLCQLVNRDNRKAA